MATLADISLNHPAWTQESADASLAVWRHDQGDALGVYFYDLPPDIGASLDDVDGLRAFYRGAVTQGGGGLVEVDVVPVGSVPAVRTIFKLPQEPSGMTYLGSLTIPFESFSFVVKSQCREHGMTGMRDATVFAAMNLPLDSRAGQAVGWAQDPYDPSFKGSVLRNRADDEEWDEKFPQHPLSRCRRNLRTLGETITLADSVVAAAPFLGPRGTKAKKRGWWPFGRT